MKKKLGNKTEETGSPVDKKQPDNPDALNQKDTVIPDECGDSLWDRVLTQSPADTSPPKNRGEDSGPVNQTKNQAGKN